MKVKNIIKIWCSVQFVIFAKLISTFFVILFRKKGESVTHITVVEPKSRDRSYLVRVATLDSYPLLLEPFLPLKRPLAWFRMINFVAK